MNRLTASFLAILSVALLALVFVLLPQGGGNHPATSGGPNQAAAAAPAASPTPDTWGWG